MRLQTYASCSAHSHNEAETEKQKATVVDEDHGVLTSLLNEVMSGLNFIKELAPKGRNCVSNDDKINRYTSFVLKGHLPFCVNAPKLQRNVVKNTATVVDRIAVTENLRTNLVSFVFAFSAPSLGAGKPLLGMSPLSAEPQSVSSRCHSRALATLATPRALLLASALTTYASRARTRTALWRPFNFVTGAEWICSTRTPVLSTYVLI